MSCEQNDDSEDDFSGYFMQSVKMYDIKEKIEEANKLLYQENISNAKEQKRATVKFSEKLVDYEPEEYQLDNISLVSSIEEDSLEEHIELNIEFSKQVSPVSKEVLDNDTHREINDNTVIKTPEIIKNDSNNNNHQNSKQNKEKTKSSSKLKRNTNKVQTLAKTNNTNKNRVNVNISNAGTQNTFKPYRSCCENNLKNKSPLPYYTGHNSEYGLSKMQLELKLKREEIQNRRKQEEFQKINELNKMKIERNEQIFCEWLKKKTNQKVLKKPQICNSSREENKNIKKIQSLKQRRPHSSPAVYNVSINLPYNKLGTSISIEDLVEDASNKTNMFNVNFET